MKEKRKKITDMSAEEARTFLLKPNSYVTLQLPEYFSFQAVLKGAEDKLKNGQIESMMEKKKLLSTEDVNHTILINKDGGYDWRPIQIIHPLLYVDLVHFVTTAEHWDELMKRFRLFQKDKKIECISIPVESNTRKSDTAETILNWWEGLEQNSIVKSLQFSYCIKTDVTNCYGSIYTHTLDWAIRGKEVAKKDQKVRSFGAKLDQKIRQMQCNQTNGIPQGGILFDFIAEIVLGYSDFLLSKELTKLNISEWRVIRYRDDYRIFSNKKEEAELIVKKLSDILSNLNMHFNSKKLVSHKI
ncbi:RNA-directed DNA polymerase [Lactiplantibacillus carotarum]|uniref:RNA-directed DNA polymerase n=1 Tax=Lactiplantibacillus carotarum TaxID=2993456 RepID=UPI00298EFA8F|nr:RNA-directed DNA polymerase [Lactiplantibacillus carotarum]